MSLCPACRRPIALARATCLYCDAPLDPSLLPPPTEVAFSPEAAPAPSPGPAGPERLVLVLDLRHAAEDVVAAGLALSPFEARQRVLRGGFQLHKIAAPDLAAAESTRLGAAGVRVITIPEVEVQAAQNPVPARSGRWSDGVLCLQTDDEETALSADHLLLIVMGVIARRYATEFSKGRDASIPLASAFGLSTSPATLDPGFRFHLHVRGQVRPLELDCGAFSLDAPALPVPSLLELREWMGRFSPAVHQDEGFRWVPPVFGPSPEGESALLGALRTDQRVFRPVHDNLRQFRFYSGWRAGVERRAQADD